MDDIILAAESDQDLNKIKQLLNKQYSMKDMGLLTHALGIKVNQDPKAGVTTLSLAAYIQAMLGRFDMQDCKPTPTPMAVETTNLNIDSNIVTKFPYRECIGALTYAACAARPDIAAAVNRCARNVETPSASDIVAAKRVRRYLQGTKSHGIKFQKAALPKATLPEATQSRTRAHRIRRRRLGQQPTRS